MALMQLVHWGKEMPIISMLSIESHERDDRFGDHIRCTGTAHVDAEDFIGFGMRQHLNRTVGVHGSARTAACLEWE